MAKKDRSYQVLTRTRGNQNAQAQREVHIDTVSLET